MKGERLTVLVRPKQNEGENTEVLSWHLEVIVKQLNRLTIKRINNYSVLNTKQVC
jgi:hypothetical protein